MLRGAKMPYGMLVLGRVATANVSARHAHPQLEPRISQPHAVLASRSARLHVAENAVDVRARHGGFDIIQGGWNLHLAGHSVESIDGMARMRGVDSVIECLHS